MPNEKQINPVTRGVLLAGGLIVLALVFRQLITLLVAILIIVIIAIPLSSAANALQRRGIPRPVGAPLSLLCGLLVIAGLIALISPAFVDQVHRLVNETPHIASDLEHKLHLRHGDVGNRVQNFLRGYTDHPSKLIGPVKAIGFTVASSLGALVLILLTAVFIAVRPEPLLDGALRLFPPDRRQRVRAVMARLREAWIGWMRGLIISMLVLGVLFYLGLLIVGLNFAVIFAVLSALAVAVPYFGAIASGIPPVLYGLTYSPGRALGVVGVYVVAHLVEGNIVAPLVMARAVRLHPALIAIGVVIIGELLGVIGLVMAVPILTAVVILVDELWVKQIEREFAPSVPPAGTVPTAVTDEELTEAGRNPG